jgi:hypothetical protein
MIGLQFENLLNFSNRTGLINLNGPLTYNNVSYNLATNIEKNKTKETRIWQDLLKIQSKEITGAQISGQNITYTATNTLRAGDIVTISNVVPPEFNNVSTTVISATASSFVVAKPSSITTNPTYFNGGTVQYGDWGDLQTVNLQTGVTKIKNSQITNAAIFGQAVRYTAANTLKPGDSVFISGVVPTEFNKAEGATVISATPTSFEILKSSTLTTETYTSGGTAQYGSPSTSWENAEVIIENLVFSIDPKAIYEKYTGSNRVVIDESLSTSGLLVDPERIRVYRDVSWVDRLKVPL